MLGWPASLQALSTWLPGWPDRPWLMHGTTITAWFTPPAPLVSGLLGPLGDAKSGRLARVRCYDVEFATANGQARAAGRFREAVLAFPARVGDLLGEVSVFMWTDSLTYLTWGREVFGWPLLPAAVELTGPAWIGGVTGSARAVSAEGTVALTAAATAERATDEPPVVAGSGTWITPRVVVPSDPAEPPRVEINAVSPRVVRPGRRRPVAAAIALSFRAGHPLSGLRPEPIRAELHSGFEISVGESVTVLSSYPLGTGA